MRDSIVDYNSDVNSRSVVVNNEIDLSKIEIKKDKYTYNNEVIYENESNVNLLGKLLRYTIALIMVLISILFTLSFIFKKRKKVFK